MAVNNNSTVNNIFNALGIKNKGIGGLASGLDTDSIVEAMLTSTRSKIAVQQQNKQLLQWKMSAYRSTAKVISALRDKHLSFANPPAQNLLASGFYSAYKATSTSDKLSVTTTGSSAPVNFTITDIHQLATAQTITAKESLSTKLQSSVVWDSPMTVGFSQQDIGKLFADGVSSGQRLEISHLGNDYDIDLSTLAGITDENDFATEFQRLFDIATDSKVTFDDSNGDSQTKGLWELTQADLDDIAAMPSGEHLIDAARKIEVKYNSGFELSALHALPTKEVGRSFDGQTLSLNVDGAVKVLRLDSLSGASSAADFQSKLQAVLDDAYGFKQNAEVGGVKFKDMTQAQKDAMNDDDWAKVRVVTAKVDSDGKMSLDASSSRVTVAVDSAVLGLKNGQTNRVDVNTKLRDIASLGGSLAGDTFTFKINGEEIVANSSDTISSLRNKINASAANVVMTYSSITDTYTLSSKITGAGDNIVMEDTYGNLLSSIFGTESSDQMASKAFAHNDGLLSLDGYSTMTKDEKLAFVRNYDGRTFTMSINGVSKEIKLDFSTDSEADAALRRGEPPTLTSLARVLNNSISSEYYSGTDGVRFTVDTSGGQDSLKLNANPGAVVLMENNRSSTTRDFLAQLGFAEGNRSNVIDFSAAGGGLDRKATELGFTVGESFTVEAGDGSTNTITVDANTSVQDLLTALSVNGVTAKAENIAKTGSPADYRLVVELDSGASIKDNSGDLLARLFGTSEFEKSAQNYGTRMQMGQNAEITLSDGTLIVNANNTFDLFEARITLNATTSPGDAPIQVGVKSDPDDLLERIETFISDYNAMVGGLNALIYEEKGGSSYTPLSDEQKATMTADQIDKWEAEAKKGLLRNDSTLRKIIDELRGAFYQKIESVGLAAYDLGITTKSLDGNMMNNGQIQLSATGRERLRMAIEQNPDSVRAVFTDPANGVAVRLQSIINNAIDTSSTSRGSLVRLAGTDMITANNTSELGNRINSIDTRLSSLKSLMETQYNRYWKQFSNLEVALSKLNSQAGLFMQQ